MKKEALRIVFMGTPEFASFALQALVENGYNVVGVVTAEDKPAGRGRKLMEPAVKTYAESKSIPVLQPQKLKSETFLEALKALEPDLQIVVAFRMLPKAVWEIPPKGTFNLHASLLPDYRGAAPINHAIINGESKTGVTTFFIDDKIDTGEIILQQEVEIQDDTTAGELHDTLMKIGSELIIETVDSILDGSVRTIPQSKLHQSGSNIKTAPKIFKEDCLINWDNKGKTIYNFIRGLSPYPAAWSYLTNKGETTSCKIYNARFLPDNNATPGKVLSDNSTFIKIGCSDGWMDIKTIQLAGKKQMPVEDLLRGFKLNDAHVPFKG